MQIKFRLTTRTHLMSQNNKYERMELKIRNWKRMRTEAHSLPQTGDLPQTSAVPSVLLSGRQKNVLRGVFCFFGSSVNSFLPSYWCASFSAGAPLLFLASGRFTQTFIGIFSVIACQWKLRQSHIHCIQSYTLFSYRPHQCFTAAFSSTAASLAELLSNRIRP